MQLDLDVGETGMRIWLLFGLVVPNVAWGATFNVCPSCTYKTIQDAIDDASSGDTINVASGSYSGGVLLDRDVDLIGTSGSASTTIRHTGQAVEVLSGVTSTIQGFTIDSTGSRAMTVNGGTVILDDIVVSGVSGHDLNGSALNVRNGATVSATDLDYSNNDAGSSLGGHIYCSDSTLTASNSTLSDGEASEQGGGLYADNCTVTLSNVDFDAHVVSEPTSVHAMGAGIYVNDSTLSVSDSLYSGNDSEEDGDGKGLDSSNVRSSTICSRSESLDHAIDIEGGVIKFSQF